MPRRNLFVLLVAMLVSMVCHNRIQVSRWSEPLLEANRYIRDDYVSEVAQRQLLEGALKGMTGTLDQHSTYFPPEDLKKFDEMMDQRFGGVGIQVAIDPETHILTVTYPLPGTPAHAAGVLAGDKILAINGLSTAGFGMDDAVKHLRGEVGEEVDMTVLHRGSTEPDTLTMKRAVIEVDSVLGDKRNVDGYWDFILEGTDKLGYLRVTGFNRNTIQEMTNALIRLEKEGMKGLILDLRGNRGGGLSEAREMCDMFIKSGDIVSLRGRDGKIMRVERATGRARYASVPMVVLIDRDSASASEIVAGCLQDTPFGNEHRAVLMGERSYGKGSVQNLLPLEGGKSALKLTIAYFYRPSGRNINKRKDSGPDDEWGVKPDPGFDIPITAAERREMARERLERETFRPGKTPDGTKSEEDEKPIYRDPQLKRAIEYLENGGGHLTGSPQITT